MPSVANSVLSALGDENSFRFRGQERVLTPALLIDRDRVQRNIESTLRLVGGNANRWRPHVKTAKLVRVMRMLADAGVKHFKCATTLELLTACAAGAQDVLMAYPAVGANAARVQEISRNLPGVSLSILVENALHLHQWRNTNVGVFIDVNPGMDRTGIGQNCFEEILHLAKTAGSLGISLRGLHYYDGHLGEGALAQRCSQANRGYGRLLDIVNELSAHRIEIPEVITSGTPTFPCAAAFEEFAAAPFIHRVSPGTIIYSDLTSLSQLPSSCEYLPAAVVMSAVVSHPAPGIFTCDAGHKSVSADAGVPTCVVLGHSEYQPLAPSEEHLPIKVPDGVPLPAVGELVFLVPRHVCPTVNNFNDAILISQGALASIEAVSARGRERPAKEIDSSEDN